MTLFLQILCKSCIKGIIRKTTVSLRLAPPNAHFTKSNQDFDLIHCAHCLSLNKKPWVADFEGVWQFSVSGEQTKIGKRFIRKIVKGRNCKRIIAWTKEAEKEILEEFPEIKNKVEIVYPAVPFPKLKKQKHKGINLLFMARYFYEKGGLHALEAINQLTKKYKDINGIVVSETPKEILKKYSSNKKIKFFSLMPQKKLFEIYAKSDIFVYPGYSDSFGFGILESMSFGIPVVTVDGFARKEIVDEGKTGFVIERPENLNRRVIGNTGKKLIEKIMDKTFKLTKNKKLLKDMSKNCVNMIKNGRFSIKERNKNLGRIYLGAISK